jgi:hypothetical protein
VRDRARGVESEKVELVAGLPGVLEPDDGFDIVEREGVDGVHGSAQCLEARFVDAGHFLAVEPIADEDGPIVADSGARQRQGLEDDVIGGEEELLKRPALEGFEDSAAARMVRIVGREEGEEETCIDEDHL